MQYSNSTHGWYPDDLTGYENIPNDLVYVSPSDYDELVQYQVISVNGKVLKLSDTFTDDQKAEIAAQQKLIQAQSEYDRVSIEITRLNDAIEDEDGDLEELNTDKAVLVDYRKSLRAFLKSDGLGELPDEPQQ